MRFIRVNLKHFSYFEEYEICGMPFEEVKYQANKQIDKLEKLMEDYK